MLRMTPSETAPPAILCVDDEPGILRSIRRSLKNEHVEVLTASSGQEALACLRDRQVALVLTDYRMPEMNGIELLEQVGQVSPDSFRIILTGYAEANVLIDAINRGQIYKVLYKPFQEEDIKLTVRSGLEHYSQACQNRSLLHELESKNRQLAACNVRLTEGLEGTKNELVISSSALSLAQQLLHEIPAAVVGVDPSGEVVFANRVGNAWFGSAATGSSMVGVDVRDVVPGPIQEGVQKVMSGSDEQCMRMTAADGMRLAVTCRPIKSLMQGQASQRRPVFLFAVQLKD
jgi:CheY-like chemotaxis protein